MKLQCAAAMSRESNRKRGRCGVKALKSRSAREFPDVTVTSSGRVTAVQAEHAAHAVGEVLASHEIIGGARARLKTGPRGIVAEVRWSLR